MDPTLLTPYGKRLAGIDPKEVEFWIMCIPRFLLEFCFSKPVFGKLSCTITHVDSAKDSEREHLLGCEFRLEAWVKMLADQLAELISIALLHLVMNMDDLASHAFKVQMAKFRYMAKLTQRIYGSISQAAGFEILAKAMIVARMVSHRKKISTIAPPGLCRPKKMIDQSVLSTS
jgi:hypothetical protein